MFCLLSDIVTEPSPIIALHTLVTYYLVTNQLINLLAIPYLVDLTDATLADEDDYSVLFVADYQHLHDATGSEQTEPDIAWFPKTLLFPSQMVTLSKPDPTYLTKPDLPNQIY